MGKAMPMLILNNNDKTQLISTLKNNFCTFHLYLCVESEEHSTQHYDFFNYYIVIYC